MFIQVEFIVDISSDTFELERFLRDEELSDDQLQQHSPTLGSASLNTVILSSCGNISNTSQSPAFSSLSSFSASNSPSCSITCSPRYSDPPPIPITIKRPPSPLQSSQVNNASLK